LNPYRRARQSANMTLKEYKMACDAMATRSEPFYGPGARQDQVFQTRYQLT
jgi:hypothetical protein